MGKLRLPFIDSDLLYRGVLLNILSNKLKKIQSK